VVLVLVYLLLLLLLLLLLTGGGGGGGGGGGKKKNQAPVALSQGFAPNIGYECSCTSPEHPHFVSLIYLGVVPHVASGLLQPFAF
jgi:hypothetical protein